jgi:hypothetical protein
MMRRLVGRAPKWAIGAAGAALAVMAFAVVKNVGYPLLWNDEGETAMFAERVLTYGYPKVSDGKNIIYCLELKDKMAGRRTPGGAYLGSGWGHFYWGAIGALAARAADGVANLTPDANGPEGVRRANVYLKTALLRLPFALAGLAAIVLAAIAVAPLLAARDDDPSAIPAGPQQGDLATRTQRGSPTRIWLFAAALFLWQALSVPWALHMREMRYYSLICLLMSWLLYLAVRRHMGRMKATRYGVLATAALVLVLMTFPVAVVAAAAGLGLGEIVRFVRKKDLKDAVAGIVPLAAAGVATGLYAIVFRSIPIAAGFAEMFPRTPEKTRATVIRIFAIFRDYESLGVIAAAFGLGIVVAVVSWMMSRKNGRSLMSRADRGLVGLSVLIAAYMIMHVAVLLRPAFPGVMNRYFIWLHPAASLVLWLNLFALGGTLRALRSKRARAAARAGLAAGFVLLAALTAGVRGPVLKKRVYELFHRYAGPMDYAVDFIQRQYPDPSRIVVATNYEEYVLQYYLGSRVIIGYVGNNLEEDMKLEPDVIVARKRGAYTNARIQELVGRAAHNRKTFPIIDTETNSIPEIKIGRLSHRFRTPRTRNEKRALEILFK